MYLDDVIEMLEKFDDPETREEAYKEASEEMLFWPNILHALRQANLEARHNEKLLEKFYDRYTQESVKDLNPATGHLSSPVANLKDVADNSDKPGAEYGQTEEEESTGDKVYRRKTVIRLSKARHQLEERLAVVLFGWNHATTLDTGSRVYFRNLKSNQIAVTYEPGKGVQDDEIIDNVLWPVLGSNQTYGRIQKTLVRIVDLIREWVLYATASGVGVTYSDLNNVLNHAQAIEDDSTGSLQQIKISIRRAIEIIEASGLTLPPKDS